MRFLIALTLSLTISGFAQEEVVTSVPESSAANELAIAAEPEKEKELVEQMRDYNCGCGKKDGKPKI